jgi:hypothetical protein
MDAIGLRLAFMASSTLARNHADAGCAVHGKWYSAEFSILYAPRAEKCLRRADPCKEKFQAWANRAEKGGKMRFFCWSPDSNWGLDDYPVYFTYG